MAPPHRRRTHSPCGPIPPPAESYFRLQRTMAWRAEGGRSVDTLMAVATAMDLPITDGVVRAEEDLDFFRGTLGVSRDVPVGFKAIRLHFDLDTEATPEQIDKLMMQVTERYCVVHQTLRQPPSCR